MVRPSWARGTFAALGIGRGDTVGFMLVNCPALHLFDCGAMHLGATCFSIYNTSSPEQIEYLVKDAANSVVVTEKCVFSSRCSKGTRERVDTLQHVVVIDGDESEGLLTTEQFEALADDGFDFDSAWQGRGAGRRPVPDLPPSGHHPDRRKGRPSRPTTT